MGLVLRVRSSVWGTKTEEMMWPVSLLFSWHWLEGTEVRYTGAPPTEPEAEVRLQFTVRIPESADAQSRAIPFQVVEKLSAAKNTL